MKNILRLVLLLAAVAIGLWAWTILFPNPKEVVRRRLNQMAQLATFTPNQGNISRTIAIEKLGLFFAEDAQVVVDIPGYDRAVFNGRAELMQSVALTKNLGNGIKTEFLDMNIEMGSDNTSAMVNLTLKAKLGGENDFIAQEFEFTLKRINGDWLVTRVESVKTLKP